MKKVLERNKSRTQWLENLGTAYTGIQASANRLVKIKHEIMWMARDPAFPPEQINESLERFLVCELEEFTMITEHLKRRRKWVRELRNALRCLIKPKD